MTHQPIPDDYDWPTITADGCTFDLHCVKDPDDGRLMLIAYRDLGDDAQLEALRLGCEATGSEVEPLHRYVLTGDITLRIAQRFHEKPEVRVVFGSATLLRANVN